VALDAPREYIVALEPTGPKPPVAAPETGAAPAAAAPVTPVVPVTPVAPITPVTPAAVAATPAPAAAASAVVVYGALEKGRYYIQIGAFGSEAVARDSIAGLKSGYAILVQKMTVKGKDTWRVFLGPLSRDESGVALVRVRAMGFKDAFVKSGS
jgi:cell division protein FtsN